MPSSSACPPMLVFFAIIYILSGRIALERWSFSYI